MGLEEETMESDTLHPNLTTNHTNETNKRKNETKNNTTKSSYDLI